MSDKKEWFYAVHLAEEPRGPFSKKEVLELIEKDVLNLDDFVWAAHLKERKWHRIFELEDFATLLQVYPKCPLPKELAKGRRTERKKSGAEKRRQMYGGENRYRRYPRAPFRGRVFLSDDHHLERADAVDISEKGLFVTKDNADTNFRLGQTLHMTICDSAFGSSFSVYGVLVRAEPGQTGYGFYFLRVDPRVKRKIARYVIDRLQNENQAEAG
jgi:hypothetical protein